MGIGIVIVSHSARLAGGVVELATQMAPDVLIRAAGGLEDGSLGTSFERVSRAIDDLLRAGDGVLVLSDLGSATMTAATAIEFLDEGTPVVLADAPLVEGAVAAAAVAQGGGTLAAVVAAAETAGHSFPVERPLGGPQRSEPGPLAPATGRQGGLLLDEPGAAAAPAAQAVEGEVSRVVRLVNEMGLHARPAAQIASLAVAQDARVTINGADATSVIALLGLGLAPNAEVTVTASGEGAEQALDAVAGLIEAGFGEAGA